MALEGRADPRCSPEAALEDEPTSVTVARSRLGTCRSLPRPQHSHSRELVAHASSSVYSYLHEHVYPGCFRKPTERKFKNEPRTGATTHRRDQGSQRPDAAETTGTFLLDKSHTEVGLLARHLMVSEVHGRFTTSYRHDVVAEDPEQSTVKVTIRQRADQHERRQPRATMSGRTILNVDESRPSRPWHQGRARLQQRLEGDGT